MTDNEIKKVRTSSKIGGVLSVLCMFLMLSLAFSGNLQGAGFFLAIEAICVFVTIRSSYIFYKKAYSDDTTTFKVPKIYRRGKTINPNHPRGSSDLERYFWIYYYWLFSRNYIIYGGIDVLKNDRE